MSDHMNDLTVALVGCGKMGRAHAMVLKALCPSVVAMERDESAARGFSAETGIDTHTGEIEEILGKMPRVPSAAVVAVNVPFLVDVSSKLIAAGCRRLLVEKPGALALGDLLRLRQVAAANRAEVFIAYNRRFFGSVMKARELIAGDGGALSVKFDFTEAARRIARLDKSAEEKANWFFANSTHVVDLAFFLAGKPEVLWGEVSGQLPWHPRGAVFVGHGHTTRGAALSYHANWLAPGRWGVEVTTTQRRLILQPLEELVSQEWDSFALTAVPVNAEIDRTYKPGLYQQIATFLSPSQDSGLKSLDDQIESWRWYERIVAPGKVVPA